MPRSLKLYIAGVVTLSAIALVVATFVFPARVARNRVASARSGCRLTPSQLDRSSLGIAFWTVLTLIASALPVDCRTARNKPSQWHRSRGDDARWPRRRRMGRSPRHDRDARGSRTDPLVRHPCQSRWRRRCRRLSRASCSLAYCRSSTRASRTTSSLSFVATMVAAAVFFVLNAGDRRALLALRTGQSITIGHRRATFERPRSTTSPWLRSGG